MHLWRARAVFGGVLPSFDKRRWPDLLAEKEIVRLWKHTGLGCDTIANYRRYLGVFFAYCAERELQPVSQLTVAGAGRFCRWYVQRGRPTLNRSILREALRSPLFAYAWALSTAGFEVPVWESPIEKAAPPPIIAEYVAHARDHRGVAESGLARDVISLTGLVGYLKRRGRHWKQVSIRDIDRFLMGQARNLAPATVGRTAYAIRGWLRFLHATGRLPHDIAPAVIAPVRRSYDQPPRALPWPEVKKLLQAIDVKTPIGRRDRAQFLLMSAYGLGAAEVVQLRFDDVDWREKRLHVVRRKTKTPITLPLLSGVARALAEYIRRGRPKLARSRYLFLSMRRPFKPFEATGVLRHRVRDLARRAGIKAAILGTHLFRHSHATRHIEIGTPMKILGDILGHRDPETTSIYTRAAVQRLRRLALPVPL